MAARGEVAEQVVSLVDAELALPLEQRPNRMSDRPLAYLKSLVLAIERSLDGADARQARKAIDLLGYHATDGLDYDTELAEAIEAYLQAVDPDP